MKELLIKLPIPDKLITLYAESKKVSEAEAISHFENLFQNMINLTVPHIMKSMDEKV